LERLCPKKERENEKERCSEKAFDIRTPLTLGSDRYFGESKPSPKGKERKMERENREGPIRLSSPLFGPSKPSTSKTPLNPSLFGQAL
jgi:hypothetical protein